MQRARRPCPTPGCDQLTDKPKGCARCRARDPARALYDSVWAAFSRSYRARHPTCEMCRRRPSRATHHAESLALSPTQRTGYGQYLALCHDCHRLVTPTVRADAGFTRRRTR